MSTQAYRDRLREARRRLAPERKRERFAESLLNDSLRYVFVAPIRCPVCRGTDHETNRTERNDGVKSQRKTCRSCEHKFIAVFQELES